MLTTLQDCEEDIPFTQYLRPHGRPTLASIARPPAIVAKAKQIIEAGYRFECEHLQTGHASFTISDDDGDHAIEICLNGPDVPSTVDRLITNFIIPKKSED